MDTKIEESDALVGPALTSGSEHAAMQTAVDKSDQEDQELEEVFKAMVTIAKLCLSSALSARAVKPILVEGMRFPVDNVYLAAMNDAVSILNKAKLAGDQGRVKFTRDFILEWRLRGIGELGNYVKLGRRTMMPDKSLVRIECNVIEHQLHLVGKVTHQRTLEAHTMAPKGDLEQLVQMLADLYAGDSTSASASRS